jgi:group I intron endonuclease
VFNLRRNRHHSPYLQHSWNKYGEGAFAIKVLELVPRDRLIEREQFYFDLWRPAYNHAPVAGSRLGVPFTDEQKARLSSRQKAAWADPKKRAIRMAGIACIDQGALQAKRKATRAERKAAGRSYAPSALNVRVRADKMRGQPSGRKPTPENIAKLVAITKARWAAGEVVHPMQGKLHSEESKAKMAAAKRGKPSVKRKDPTKCVKGLHEWIDGKRECRGCARIAWAAWNAKRNGNRPCSTHGDGAGASI